MSELIKLVPNVPRAEIVRESLTQNGGVFLCEDLSKCIELVNEFAPEHVQVMTKNSREIANRITSAGLILIGDYTPVAASDYCLGTNHVLPTQGYCSIYSGLTVLDFVRIVRIAETSKEVLKDLSKTICTLADAEGLMNHSRAIGRRFDE
ncbi:MAG: histidinol dehydrogenase [Candidatus Thorarchaeota archaeon]